ncbi:MAG: ribosome biogenesis GTPase Der [Chitinophagaceae bacterium]|nr:ribosome biogenesis GTPase Der [Chitinophagaceae bacterium]
MPGFTVAIVGRPNVGKSTLFNRLLEQRKAIVDDVSGVTRDRQYGVADWNGKNFNVIDTGGFVSNSEDVFEREIRKQVVIALEEADLIIFVCDVATGITDQDSEMANMLRKSTKPMLVVVNKVDNGERALEATEFYSLGFEHTFFISSISGSGTGDLLDKLTEYIPEEKEEETEENPLPKFIIIGQPNAGKSTLLNALTGKERTIVSDIPGTTRDTIHTHYNQFGKEFILIDTAGLRKKKNVHEDLEFYSVIRAVRAIDDVDVCLLMIDAEKGITAQDINIFSLAARKGKGVVILVNKWDTVEKETNTAKAYEEEIKKRIAPFSDVPILFISAKEKTRIFKAMDMAIEVYENRSRRIPTSKLNDTLLKEIERNPPPMTRGHAVKIKFVQQIPTVVPSFAFYANYPDAVKTPYKNFLENKLRSYFDFNGVPIRIFMRKK